MGKTSSQHRFCGYFCLGISTTIKIYCRDETVVLSQLTNALCAFSVSNQLMWTSWRPWIRRSTLCQCWLKQTASLQKRHAIWKPRWEWVCTDNLRKPTYSILKDVSKVYHIDIFENMTSIVNKNNQIYYLNKCIAFVSIDFDRDWQVQNQDLPGPRVWYE